MLVFTGLKLRDMTHIKIDGLNAGLMEWLSMERRNPQKYISSRHHDECISVYFTPHPASMRHSPDAVLMLSHHRGQHWVDVLCLLDSDII